VALLPVLQLQILLLFTLFVLHVEPLVEHLLVDAVFERTRILGVDFALLLGLVVLDDLTLPGDFLFRLVVPVEGLHAD